MTAGVSATSSPANFSHGVGLAVAQAVFDAYILSVYPAQLLKRSHKRRYTVRCFSIPSGPWRQHTDASDAFGLLRASGQRPGDSRAAKECDECAPPHLIASLSRHDKRVPAARRAHAADSTSQFSKFRPTGILPRAAAREAYHVSPGGDTLAVLSDSPYWTLAMSAMGLGRVKTFVSAGFWGL